MEKVGGTNLKQTIYKDNSNGSIWYKYYENEINQRHNLEIYYWENGNLSFKQNWFNGKLYGLSTEFNRNGEIIKQTYKL